MSAVFRKYYLRELKQLWEGEKLEYHGTAATLQNHYGFKSLLDNLYDKTCAEKMLLFYKKDMTCRLFPAGEVKTAASKEAAVFACREN